MPDAGRVVPGRTGTGRAGVCVPAVFPDRPCFGGLNTGAAAWDQPAVITRMAAVNQERPGRILLRMACLCAAPILAPVCPV